MNTQILLDKYFETAFSAPDGIKRLRELILSLAIQGKLVPQDPNDQPAKELLKEIEAEKQRLIQDHGLKTKAEIYIAQDEEYTDKPKGWSFYRLGNLTKFIDYRGKTPKKISSGIPLITAKNVRFGFIDREPREYVSEEEYHSWMTRGFPKFGDLLFTTEAPLGNIAIVDIDERFALAQRVICFQLHKPEMNLYLRLLIMSNIFQEQLINNATGMTAKGIKASKLKEIPIPIPPLSEQKRIVEKCDRLMEQCDKLEKLRAEKEQKRILIHTAAREKLLTAKDQEAFGQAWDFIKENFGELYAVKENVTSLRQAILQLAVMGKLVPQDPNDPPASELLKEIEAEKQRLIKEKKIKKQKSLPEIKPEEIPYDLPEGWKWLRLGNSISYMDAGWSPKCENWPAKNDEWGVLKTTSVQSLNFLEYENKLLPKQLSPRPELEVKNGDILITRAGPKNRVGICCVVKSVRSKLMLSDKIIRFRFFNESIFSDYCALSLSTGYGADQVEILKSGMAESQMNISQEKIKTVVIPLPPLPEQHRIVAKVDALMALCDQLEQQIEQQTAKQTQLLEAVMAGV